MLESKKTKSDFIYDDQGRAILGSAKEMVAWVELGFEEQEEPDISHVSITELIPSTNTKLYDLNGVQVTKPKKGIYISNGKKFSFIR